MKRLLPFILILLFVHAAITHHRDGPQPDSLTHNLNGLSETSSQLNLVFYDQPNPGKLSQFARQAASPAAPIEETQPISWWWWVLGVVLVIAGGMFLYVLMKKDPRKDAR